MSSSLNGEEILCCIITHKTIKSSSTVANVFANLISGGVAGRVTNDFKLTLTNEKLYIEATTYSAWGGLPETLYTDKISREDINSFEVKSEGAEEIIEIITTDDKTMSFVRDNEKNNDLALVMSTLISKNKQKALFKE